MLLAFQLGENPLMPEVAKLYAAALPPACPLCPRKLIGEGHREKVLSFVRRAEHRKSIKSVR